MRNQTIATSQLQVMVFGAGTMGHGIALLAGKSGHKVYLNDADDAALNRAMELIEAHLKWFEEENEISEPIETVLQRIEPVKAFRDVIASCDLIIEAITEDPTLKAGLFKQIAPFVSVRGIVVSNTSYLDVFSLAPEEMLPRLAITHFYVPPYLVPLVEVVGSDKTDPDIVPWLMDILGEMGQQPIALKKFIPGFIVNRLQRAMGREIFNLLEEDVADPEQIDAAVKASLGMRFPVTGVVQKFDLTGLDLVLKILKNPSIHLATEDKIPKLLQERVEAGDYGVKTGRGFYDYGGRSVEEIIRDLNRRFLSVRRFMEKEVSS
jgi:3-hydroxybutyryl-CoA dehydrogenase